MHRDLSCHHLFDEGECIYCGTSQITPAAQGHTARYAITVVETFLLALGRTPGAETCQELHDAVEGLSCEMELYPQREAFLVAEFLRDACAALRLLGKERRRTVTVTDALRGEASLSLRQARDMCRDWDRAAELARGRDVARLRMERD